MKKYILSCDEIASYYLSNANKYVAQSVVVLSRLELHADNNKPELVFMEQVEEVSTELQQVSNFYTKAAISVQLVYIL
jgi:hypothetical protein